MEGNAWGMKQVPEPIGRISRWSMKRIVFYLLLCLFVSGCTTKQTDTVKNNSVTRTADPIFTDFNSFITKYNSKTQVQQDAYWQELKGHTVQWSGSVNDAYNDSTNKEQKRIIVHVGGSNFLKVNLSKEVNVDLSKLNKGDSITIRGTLNEQGGLLQSWGISEATIVNKK
ncbi:hypothetical protein FE783_12880 [Paenibacillus mesophilus]|uniref:hypothetical protein n=1 Tax=Paenibacillus mesophilus TaxID=2582849 RepID=UPI00110EAB50|nr:hypothetical protein [Paenibacillus mesophilus]TMV49402.1 hypothetical protein FE783_12880 [Paenibacillus mesophilus]